MAKVLVWTNLFHPCNFLDLGISFDNAIFIKFKLNDLVNQLLGFLML
jgi:hypothetical protein